MNCPLTYRPRTPSDIITTRIKVASDRFLTKSAHAHKWGLVSNAVLPPMTGEEPAKAIADASDSYWSGHISKAEHRELVLAIEAAQAAGRAGKSKSAGNGALRTALLERDGPDCWLCGEEMGDDCTIEHKHPLALGGTWAVSNLALAHSACNALLSHAGPVAKAAARDAIREARS